MKITLREFVALPDQEQYNVIFIIGNFLDIINEEQKKYVLFAVDKFFVEVEYNSDKNKIQGKTAFVQGELLDNMLLLTDKKEYLLASEFFYPVIGYELKSNLFQLLFLSGNFYLDLNLSHRFCEYIIQVIEKNVLLYR